jgi:hypothetical protein
MSHSITIAVPLYLNPAFQPGLDVLSLWLAERGYSTQAIDRILAHAAIHGTPTGSPYLDADDEAGATDAFVDGLEPVLGDSSGWDDPSVFIDADSLREAAEATSEPEGDRSIPGDAILVPPEFEDLLDAPALSGGAPQGDDAERFKAGDRHSADALARIHLALYGRSEPFHA